MKKPTTPPPAAAPPLDEQAIRADQAVKIREARTAAGRTQQQVADHLGVTKGAVSEWEGGKSSPRPSLQIALATYLGVRHSTLFGFDS